MPSNPEPQANEPALTLKRLLPAASPATVEQFVDELQLVAAAEDEKRERPYLLLNMIATADGRATLGGRSGPLGGRADKELLYGLRTAVDAVMAGGRPARAPRHAAQRPDDRARPKSSQTR